MAVENVGLNQIREVEQEVFSCLPQYYDMFMMRLGVLREAVKVF